MKRLLLSTLTFLSVISVSLAQKADTVKKASHHKYQFGIKLGFGETMMSSNAPLSKDDKEAGVLGFWGKYQFCDNSKLSLQPELFFGRYGEAFYGQDANSVPQSGATIVYFNTYNLPVLLNYKIGKKKFSGHLITGPMLQIITKHDKGFSGDYFKRGLYPNTFNNLLQWDNNLAVYWAAGAGIDYKFLTLDVRYTQGINNINTAGYSQRLNNVVASLAIKIF